MNDRYKSRKQAVRFSKGKSSMKAKVLRQKNHRTNPETGKGEWVERRWDDRRAA